MSASRAPRNPPDRGAPPRLWTVEEANARLAGLRELLPQLQAWAARLGEVHGELGRLARFWGEELGSRDQPDHGLHARLEAEWRNLTRRLDEAVASLRAEGIEVKQLGSGLVDFYALLDDELVLLCWKVDESEVGFYHTLEGGFAGRRPPPARGRTVPTESVGRS
jgi:hypothetical protein